MPRNMAPLLVYLDGAHAVAKDSLAVSSFNSSLQLVFLVGSIVGSRNRISSVG